MDIFNSTPSPTDYVDFHPTDARNAALSVAFLFALSAIFLALLKRSGFRAMVAVGRA